MLREVTINLQKDCSESEPFCFEVAAALREYAQKVDDGELGNTDEEYFLSKNDVFLSIKATISK